MIVSSTFTEGPVQACGRRYVSETHVADNGETYQFEWLGTQDAQTVVDARIVILNDASQGTVE